MPSCEKVTVWEKLRKVRSVRAGPSGHPLFRGLQGHYTSLGAGLMVVLLFQQFLLPDKRSRKPAFCIHCFSFASVSK